MDSELNMFMNIRVISKTKKTKLTTNTAKFLLRLVLASVIEIINKSMEYRDKR
jgi:hypothetical protein